MNKNTNKIIIITSYIENSINFQYEINKDPIIICTDGGYNYAYENNLNVSYVIGDLDSISYPIKNNIEVIKYNPIKDYTDLDLALKKIIELNTTNYNNSIFDVKILGGIGGRLDHTFANIQLLSNYHECFNSLTINDGKNAAIVLSSNNSKTYKINKNEFSFSKYKKLYFSIFSLTSKSSGINLSGSKYTLNNADLTSNFPLGVSNEFIDESISISFNDGTILFTMSCE